MALTIDRLSLKYVNGQAIVAALCDDRLVTRTGRRMSRKLEELVAGTGYGEKAVGAVLEELRSARIITPVSAPRGEGASRETFYEFSHDLMAKAAADWFERYDRLRRLEAERQKARADEEQAEAHRLKEDSVARELAIGSRLSLDIDPDRSILLAMHAISPHFSLENSKGCRFVA